MMIEAHWKVLKRNYLYFHHRARLDLLIYVLATKHYDQQAYRWDLMVETKIELSAWETDAIDEWNEVCGRDEEADADAAYVPDVVQWICGCPAYARSRFPLCKHLVNRSGHNFVARRKKRVVRNLRPPFITLVPPEPTRGHPWQRNATAIPAQRQAPSSSTPVVDPSLRVEVESADQEQRQLLAHVTELRDALTTELEGAPSLGQLRSLFQSLRSFERHAASINMYNNRRTIPTRQDLDNGTRYIN